MRRPVHWLGSTKKDLDALPASARKDIGVALYIAQCGERSAFASPMVGFGGASVLEIVTDVSGNTYRGVYTVRFAEAVYVLHVFQKKSKRGAAVPKLEMELIKERLQDAVELHKRHLAKQSGGR